MLPSLRVQSFPLQALPAIHSQSACVYADSRDEAICIAFCAFDTPVECTDPMLRDAPGGAVGRGVHINAIDDYLKCILGLPHQSGMIRSDAAQHLEAINKAENGTLYPLSVPRLTALTAFYLGLCQGCAFNAAGDFDTRGLIDFIATRLALPKDLLEQDLTGSAFGAHVFMAMRRDASAPQLSIYGSQGQALRAPSPSLRFDEGPPATICNSYLRNVTISSQTVSAVDMTAVDLSGAYIDNSLLIGLSFSTANLYNVVFNETFAAHCHFDGTNLVRAKFRNSRVSYTRFQNCQMASSSFDASELLATRFERCDLRDMVFDNEERPGSAVRLSIKQSEFASCDMTGARLRHLQWRGGGLSDCVMWDASISDSVFMGMTWKHPVVISTKSPLSGAKLSALQFHDCTLTYLNAGNSAWTTCAFEKGNLADASWRNSALRAMRFTDVVMPRARFDNSSCEGLRVEAMCNLEGVSFVDAKMTKVRFDGGAGKAMLGLRRVDFSCAALNNVEFVRCQMGAAKFFLAQFQSVNFIICSLNHADFSASTGANLLHMLLVNPMRHYRSDGMAIGEGEIGSLRSSKRRADLLNHITNKDCLLARVVAGSTGSTTAQLVLLIADSLLHEADDPVDSDSWMIAALSAAFKNTSIDSTLRARIDVHLSRMLRRHLLELTDVQYQAHRHNKWWVDALAHVRRLQIPTPNCTM